MRWPRVFVALAPGLGAAASFNEAGPNGFQVGFVSDAEIEALDSLTIDEESVPFFLSAGVDPAADVVFSQSVCILPQGGSTCQVESLEGPVSAIVTWEISAINSSEIQGPFTLILEGLVSPLEQPRPSSDISRARS